MTRVILLVLMLLPGFSAVAEDAEERANENRLVDKIVAAYGGDAVTNLKSYIEKKSFIAPAAGQSRRPELDDLGVNDFYVAHDIQNDELLYETNFIGPGGSFQGATLRTDGKTLNLNPVAGTYGESPNPDPYVFAGGSMRTNDVMLAREVDRVRDDTTYLGETDYMNRPHEMLEMPFPSSPNLTLYIDKETGLISKMVRINPALGQLDYVFSDMRESNGIPYAGKTDFFVAGAANLITSYSDVTFNADIEQATFAIPTGYGEEGERVDTSEMSATKLGDGIYHIGQGFGFTLFVDTSMGIVAVGGYPQLTERLARYRKESGNHKPLAYQVVSHHHSDHLPGISEAEQMGATLVAAPDHVAPVRDSLPDDASPRFLTVEDRMTLGDGKNRVDIYNVSTMHSADYLVVHVPTEKLIFIADHMGSPYKTGVPTANINTVTMHKALAALDIDIRDISVAHGARIFTWKEMEQSVAAYEPSTCAGDRPVCKLR